MFLADTVSRWTPIFRQLRFARLYCSPRKCASLNLYLWQRRKLSEFPLITLPVAGIDAFTHISVETCLKMCGLEAYGDATVGSLGIEHRKRTTIGVELAAKVLPVNISTRFGLLTSTLPAKTSVVSRRANIWTRFTERLGDNVVLEEFS